MAGRSTHYCNGGFDIRSVYIYGQYQSRTDRKSVTSVSAETEKRSRKADLLEDSAIKGDDEGAVGTTDDDLEVAQHLLLALSARRVQVRADALHSHGSTRLPVQHAGHRAERTGPYLPLVHQVIVAERIRLKYIPKVMHNDSSLLSVFSVSGYYSKNIVDTTQWAKTCF